jgi:hypothetical protein
VLIYKKEKEKKSPALLMVTVGWVPAMVTDWRVDWNTKYHHSYVGKKFAV